MPDRKDYLKLLLIAFLLFVAGPTVFFRDPEPGLDASWGIALHLAIQNHFTFGTDFVFTYGPLGILYTRLPIGIPYYVYLLFDILFVSQFVWILWWIFKRHFSVWSVLYVFIGLTIITYEGAEQWYFFFFLFHTLRLIYDPTQKSSLFFSLILSVLCFYIKLSLGIISLVLFVVGQLYLLLTRKSSITLTSSVFATLAAVVVVSAQALHVHLIPYVLNSLSIINAYNDAMAREVEKEFLPFLFVAWGVVALLVAAALLRLRHAILQYATEKSALGLEVVSLFVIGLFAFVEFKNGLVRGNGHNFYFFRGIVFPIALLCIFYASTQTQRTVQMLGGLALALCLWAVNTLPGSYKPVDRLTHLTLFPIRAQELSGYLYRLRNYKENPEPSPGRANDWLRQGVGHHSIDVVPTEISQVYFNQLAYRPRPVIQSYSAYSGPLDSLNQAKYTGAQAPEFILYSAGTIDNRYSFYDETSTRLALLSHYKMADAMDDQLLLKRREQPATWTYGSTTVMTGHMGEEIRIPSDSALLLSRISIRYSLVGKLQRLFYKPPPLTISLTLETGDVYTYKGIITQLNSGVILNKYVESRDEFELLMRSHGMRSSAVSSIRVDAPYGYHQDFEITSVPLRWTPPPGYDPKEDALALQEIFNQYKAERTQPLPVTKSSVAVGIDQLKAHPPFIQVVGWAFDRAVDNSQTRSSIVLVNGQDVYALPTSRQLRQDLVQYFQRKDVGETGFSAHATIESLPPAAYVLGIRLSNKMTGTDQMFLTDRVVNIEKMITPELLSGEFQDTGSDQQVYLDKAVSEMGLVRVEGWSFHPGLDPRNEKRYLVLYSKQQAYRIEAHRRVRPDLADHFHDSVARFGGFSIVIRQELLPPDSYRIGWLSIDSKGKTTKITTNHSIQTGRDIYQSGEKMDSLPQPGKMESHIDVLEYKNEIIQLEGWAAPPDAGYAGCTTYVVLIKGNEILRFPTRTTIRTDVTSYFENRFNLDSAGFSLRVARKDLGPGAYHVGILLKTRGQYIYADTGKELVRE